MTYQQDKCRDLPRDKSFGQLKQRLGVPPTTRLYTRAETRAHTVTLWSICAHKNTDLGSHKQVPSYFGLNAVHHHTGQGNNLRAEHEQLIGTRLWIHLDS